MAKSKFLCFSSREPLHRPSILLRLQKIFTQFSPQQINSRLFLDEAGCNGLFVDTLEENNLSRKNGIHYFTNHPFGLSKVVKITNTENSLAALARLMRDKPETIAKISPPVAMVSLTDDGSMSVNVDIRGLAEVYYVEKNDFFLFSNVLHWLNLFINENSQEDSEGSSLRAVFSYYPGEFTPLKSVKRLAGGTSFFADALCHKQILSSKNYLLEGLAASYQLTFSTSQASDIFLENLECYLNETKLFGSENYSQGLTGGRDSRLILAGLVVLGRTHDVEFHTIDTMRIETELARKIVDTTGLNLSYEVRTPSQKILQSGEYKINDHEILSEIPGLVDINNSNPLAARFLWHFLNNNGQVMPGIYFKPPRKVFNNDESFSSNFRWIISGVSGEVLRAPKYSQDAIDKGVLFQIEKTLRSKFNMISPRYLDRSKGEILDYLTINNFSFSGTNRYYNQDSASNAANVYLSIIREANSAGILDFRMFDYFAIAAQQSRRIGLGKNYNVVAPLSAPDLMNYAFRLSPSERAEDSFHVKILANIMPSFCEIPFGHRFKTPKNELRRDNSRFPMICDEENGISGFSKILNNVELWSDTYDVARTQHLFHNNNKKLNDYQLDRLACQLAWRAVAKLYGPLIDQQL